MRVSYGYFCTALMACLVFCAAVVGQTSSSLESRRKALNDLLAEQWEYRLQASPLFASFIGDKRWNDKLDDLSSGAIDAHVRETRKFLERFEAIDTAGFPEQEALNRELIVRDLRLQVEGARFKSWEMPVDQYNGVQVSLPQMVNTLSFAIVKDYEDYIARLRQIPRYLEQNTVLARKGMAEKLMQPRYLLEKSTAQAQAVAADSPEHSHFAQPFEKFPAGISEADQKRLRGDGIAAIRDSVLPAYKKFTAFLRDEYAPKGRTEPGVWQLPDGADRYRLAVRYMTTTDMTPDEIHQIGLKEVARIEAEMLEVARKLGFSDLATFNVHIKSDKNLYGTSGQQILDLYAKYAREMEPELPKLFGRLPRAKLEAIPMEMSRAKDSVPADYTSGTPDGSRPGHINVNEWDPEHRLLLNLEAIAYHEGVPGHHLQLSLAQEMTGLPAFRKYEDYTAYVEGWAFYSERLGKDVGRYQDAYSDYGRLENEMWRAIRLVIDTGVHEKHWSREQMVDYFHRYTAMDEPNVQTEVDRYICWPGQALGYKLGQLKILELREFARQQLGDKFDIRAFHDEVLGAGALPLEVLDRHVRAWVAAQKPVSN